MLPISLPQSGTNPKGPDDSRIVDSPTCGNIIPRERDAILLSQLCLSNPIENANARIEIRTAEVVLNAITGEWTKIAYPHLKKQRVQGKRDTNLEVPYDRKISSAKMFNKTGQIVPTTAANIIGNNMELFSTDEATRTMLQHITSISVDPNERQNPIKGAAPNAIFEEIRLGYHTGLTNAINEHIDTVNGTHAEKFTLVMALQAVIAQIRQTVSHRPSVIVTSAPSPHDPNHFIVVAGQTGGRIQIYDTSELPTTINATDCAIVYPINLRPTD